MTSAIYDKIGVGYGNVRRTDPKIAKQIWAKLGPGLSLLNVGAGTGSYEPDDWNVVALEPSSEMICQRAPDAAPIVLGHAEDIPFADKQFDVAMGVLTIHHWDDADQGLAEMMRVARDRIVLLTYDPLFSGFWLEDYIPDLLDIDRHCFPPMEKLSALRDRVDIEPLLIPHDCVDGFLCAYWRRPDAYLDPQVRNGISSFSKLKSVDKQIDRLREDLNTGAWRDKYGHLLNQQETDLGYRLVTVEINS